MTFAENDINILFEDNDITVCEKPEGILSEDSQNGEKGIIGLNQKTNCIRVIRSRKISFSNALL